MQPKSTIGRPPMMFFTGTANPDLAAEVAERLGVSLGGLKITRFADGELYVKFEESVRGADVFLLQPICPPIDQNNAVSAFGRRGSTLQPCRSRTDNQDALWGRRRNDLHLRLATSGRIACAGHSPPILTFVAAYAGNYASVSPGK